MHGAETARVGIRAHLAVLFGRKGPIWVKAAHSSTHQESKKDLANMIDGAERLQFGTYFMISLLTRAPKLSRVNYPCRIAFLIVVNQQGR